jgi:hypothetical protein
MILISSSVNPYKLIHQPVNLPVGGFDLAFQELLNSRHPGVCQLFVEIQHPLT